MDSKQVIAILAVIAVTVAVVNLAVTFIKINDFRKEVSGFASGYVNISVVSSVSISLPTSQIDWGGGVVNTSIGCTNSTLYTIQNISDGSVDACGNWSGTGVHGLRIRNDGNVNVTLNASTDRNAADMFGGTAARQAFQWNWTNAEAGSCTGGNIVENTWADVNKSPSDTLCGEFNQITDSNEIFLDILLRVPDDFSTALYPGTTERMATITIIGTAN